MKLFTFIPNEIGYAAFYIMSENEDKAIQNLCKLEEFDIDFWLEYKHKYTIKTYEANEPTWMDVC